MKKFNAVSAIALSAAVLNISAFVIHGGAANLCVGCFCALAATLPMKRPRRKE